MPPAPTRPGDRAFSVAAMRYPSQGAASRAYERMMPALRRWRGGQDSLYRCVLDGQPTVVALCWGATAARMAEVAALPWGEGAEPVVLPLSVVQQLAQRSQGSMPQRPGRTRHVARGPTGRVLSDRELPTDD